MYIFRILIPVMINNESVSYLLDIFWQDSNHAMHMHAVIYIVFSIFKDLKLERIIGLPYLRI